MRRKLITSLLGLVFIAVALLSTNLIAGYRPALGLDLQGGTSVTLRPADKNYNPKSLKLAVERIRARVDSFGVGEPEIFQQGDAIVVNLPGVNDRDAALKLVSVTGKVFLRPVLACGPVPSQTPTSTSVVSVNSDGSVTPGSSSATTATGGSSAGTVADTTPGTTNATTGSSPGPAPSVQSLRSTPPKTPDSTPVANSTASTDAANEGTVPVSSDSVPLLGATSTTAPASTSTIPSTGVVSDPTSTQILPDRDGALCQVGPSPQGATGEIFEKDSARSRVAGGSYSVDLTLNDSGLGIWNQLAQECYNKLQTCPSGLLAIELDGQIQTHPNVNQPNFTSGVQITGRFTKGEADQLADVINSGALPVTLKTEAIQKVSASLGKDSLKAAVVAGIVGVGLVLLLMMLYYKRLALVVVAGLCISGTLIFSITALMSRFYNGVLSLSGIAGIIVSIGVTIDSYVVFFERLKDEIRSGRSLRNSAQRGFTGAWRTIVVADCASLIGAVVLWNLTVGSVRGFAFYLGLSTLTDLVVAYFFTRPAILLLARSSFMRGKKILGIDTSLSETLETGKLAGAAS